MVAIGNEHRAERAAELHVPAAQIRRRAVRIHLAERGEATVVLPDRFERVGDVSIVVHRVLATEARHGLRRVLPERPLNDVEVVRAHVRELPAGVRGEPAEFVQALVRVEWHLRRRPEPTIPVQPGWRFAVGGVADAHRRFVPVHVALRHRHFADRAVANEFHRFLNVRRRTAMQPDLRNTLRFQSDLAHSSPFADRQRGGFLDVNIFPRAAGIDELHRVPMVRRRNHRRIDRLVFEQLAMVVERLRRPARFLVRGRQIRFVHIAQCSHFAIVVDEKRIEQLIAAIAHADEAETNAIVRTVNATITGRRQRSGGNGKRTTSRTRHR